MKDLLDAQDALRKATGGEAARTFDPPKNDVELKSKVKALTWEKVKEAYARNEKHDRYGRLSEIKKELLAALKEQAAGDAQKLANLRPREGDQGLLRGREVRVHAKMITDEGRRIGGRGRPRSARSERGGAAAPRHGSALFTRGETQALVATTLGTAEDEQRVEMLTGMVFRRFMLHYNFPPFSVEAKFLRGPGRREIGHGALAERALRQVLPPEDKFLHTIRIVSDIMESNGSSSMASVCGGSPVAHGRGVPIKAPVAGIAMGLIKEGEKIAILSDILGDEDHLGDMDFKVCGTAEGITSIQMDIKIGGVTREILEKALPRPPKAASTSSARWRRRSAAPRRRSAPTRRDHDHQDPAGAHQGHHRPRRQDHQGHHRRTGTSINIEDDGSVSIASPSQEKVEAAIKMIRCSRRRRRSARPTSAPSARSPSSAPSWRSSRARTASSTSPSSDKRVKSVSDVLSEGEEVLVKVISVDRAGKIRPQGGAR